MVQYLPSIHETLGISPYHHSEPTTYLIIIILVAPRGCPIYFTYIKSLGYIKNPHRVTQLHLSEQAQSMKFTMENARYFSEPVPIIKPRVLNFSPKPQKSHDILRRFKNSPERYVRWDFKESLKGSVIFTFC